ncbi:MAG: PIN domain-containing protein [Chloroflexota bacterium]|nr:PIN domain-containing protein [Chloroflexota bacterium]
MLIDSSTLIPLNPRDLFLDAARTIETPPLCRIFWSVGILAEVEEHIARTMTRIPESERPNAVARIMRLFREEFPAALVTDYERYIPQMQPADPDDRHVAAAAYRARVDAIVTSNDRHFPPATFAGVRYRPRIWTPDDFATRLVAASPERLHRTLERQVEAAKRRDPDRTVVSILDGLAGRLPQFATAMHAYLRRREENTEGGDADAGESSFPP